MAKIIAEALMVTILLIAHAAIAKLFLDPGNKL